MLCHKERARESERERVIVYHCKQNKANKQEREIKKQIQTHNHKTSQNTSGIDESKQQQQRTMMTTTTTSGSLRDRNVTFDSRCRTVLPANTRESGILHRGSRRKLVTHKHRANFDVRVGMFVCQQLQQQQQQCILMSLYYYYYYYGSEVRKPPLVVINTHKLTHTQFVVTHR